MKNKKMKVVLLFVVSFLFSGVIMAQSFAINTDGSTANSSAMLDIKSATKGLLIPRLTSTERNAIPAPANGLVVYDTDTKGFWYHNGTGWIDLVNSNDTYWRKLGNNIYNSNTGNIGVGTSTPVNRLSVVGIADVSESVGIGTTNPGFPLNFANTLGDKISLYGNSGAHYGVGIQGSLLQIHSAGSVDDIAFGYGSSNSFTERMRIKGSGAVGIGINNPSYILEVNGRSKIYSGGTNATSAGIWFNNNANNALTGFTGMENDNSIGFYGTGTPNGWGLVMEISTGNVGIGTSSPTQKLHVIGNILATGTITPSDRRYKKNIQPLENALAKLQQLNGVTYEMNRQAFPEWNFEGTRQYGLIAQEVENVFPEMVKEIHTDGYKGIDYVKLVPVLIEAIKELKKENNCQQAQIDRLIKAGRELQ